MKKITQADAGLLRCVLSKLPAPPYINLFTERNERMFCHNCGTQLDDGVAFCHNCGTALQAPPAQQPAPQQPVYQQQPIYQQAPAGYSNVVFVHEPPMKWFKFLIYFYLWAEAVLNIIGGIGILTGASYQGQADLVYAMIDGLKGFDIFIGLYSIALGGFAIFVRFRLANYKKNGPLMIMIQYLAVAVLALIYIIGMNAIVPSYILEFVDLSSMYSNLIVSIVFVIVNHIYFQKRSDMFVW